jgi:uncharacterized protein YicC (UPF0701 family)
MSLIDGMQTLKNEIRASRGKRRQDLKNIKQDTRGVQQDAREALADFKETRQEEAKNLAKDLTSFTENLTADVNTLQKGFRQDQAKVRKDVLGASRVWAGIASAKDVPEAKEDDEQE